MKKIQRKSFCALFLFAAVCLFSSANAQVYQKGLIDKTVALIGNEAILISQIEQDVQMRMAQGMGMSDEKLLRCQILEDMLTQKLLVNQAKLDSLSPRTEYVEMELENRLDRIMTQLGGQQQTEDYFKKPIFKLKDEWRTLLNEQSLWQQEQQQVMASAGSLTPSDVKKFYKRVDKDSLPVVSTQYRMSQIVLYPEKEKAVMAVKEKLLEFRQRVLNGEKFSMLAALYSEDPGTAVRGGELRMASKNIYWPAFSDAAMSLKDGQISQIVETPDGFHLIQMIEKKGDMFNARHILLRPKYTDDDRSKAFARLDSLKREIAEGNTTFNRAAQFYSQDLKTYLNGGQMADENTGSIYFEKDQLDPSDYAKLKDMKVGEVSDPFESAEFTMSRATGQTIYKIIKLDEILPSHQANIKEDFTLIQNIATNELQQKALEDFISEKQKITFIRIDDMFKDCPFRSKGWLK